MKFDQQQLRDLAALMEELHLRKIRLRKSDEEIEIESGDNHSKLVEEEIAAWRKAAREKELSVSHHPPFEPTPTTTPPVERAVCNVITAPIVGTFYRSHSPDEKSFVQVGQQVQEDTIVCIIEAMKVMNEVKAGVKGIITEILVENGHPVEFGTKLFIVS